MAQIGPFDPFPSNAPFLPQLPGGGFDFDAFRAEVQRRKPSFVGNSSRGNPIANSFFGGPPPQFTLGQTPRPLFQEIDSLLGTNIDDQFGPQFGEFLPQRVNVSNTHDPITSSSVQPITSTQPIEFGFGKANLADELFTPSGGTQPTRAPGTAAPGVVSNQRPKLGPGEVIRNGQIGTLQQDNTNREMVFDNAGRFVGFRPGKQFFVPRDQQPPSNATAAPDNTSEPIVGPMPQRTPEPQTPPLPNVESTLPSPAQSAAPVTPAAAGSFSPAVGQVAFQPTSPQIPGVFRSPTIPGPILDPRQQLIQELVMTLLGGGQQFGPNIGLGFA